jgi:Rrf2 family protein
MILSRACEYGIQGLLLLVDRPPGRFVTVKEIARSAKVSAPFLSKVLGQLAVHGLLSTSRGPRGGVRLARPAEEIKVLDVVEAIDGLGFLKKCVIGLPRCSSESPCPFHSRWGPLREDIGAMFSKKSIRELVDSSSGARGKAPGGGARRTPGGKRRRRKE